MKTTDMYKTVLDVGATLVASLDLDEVLATIARQVGQALGVTYCDINEYDEAANTMTYVAVWAERLTQEDLDYLGTVVSLADRPGRDEVIRKGDIVTAYLDDPDLDPRERAVMEQYDEQATMEMPLVYGSQAIGVLGVIDSSPGRRFDDEEKELLRSLSGPAAIAIGNARAYRAQRERARRTTALLDSSRAMAASVDLDEVLDQVGRLAGEALGCSRSAVFEYRPETDSLTYRARYERPGASVAPPDDDLGSTYALGDFPGEGAILGAGAVVEEQLSDESLPVDRRASMTSRGEHTCLSVPLQFDGAPVGLLRLYELEAPRHFTAGETELIASLGELASAAIHSARLFRRQREHSERLMRLFETSRGLTATFDLATITAAAEDGARALVDHDLTVAVWLLDEERGLVPARPAPSVVATPPDPGRTGLAALTDLRPVQTSGDAGSELSVPFVVKGRAEGLLRLAAADRRVFTDVEVEALQVLANHVAVALENVRLYRRVEQQAIRDGLTGLYNHRHFHERLLQECLHAQRYRAPLSLLMLDLDDFKRFNDEFGHQLGDEALREIGALLLRTTRLGVDLPARYGGEEFAVILPYTSAVDTAPAELGPPSGRRRAAPPAGPGALAVAERLRRTVEEHAFAGHGGRRYAHVSVSIGTAMLGKPSRTADELVRDADRALYAAKSGGKNRVEVSA